jgi:hypothetical protein
MTGDVCLIRYHPNITPTRFDVIFMTAHIYLSFLRKAIFSW